MAEWTKVTINDDNTLYSIYLVDCSEVSYFKDSNLYIQIVTRIDTEITVTLIPLID